MSEQLTVIFEQLRGSQPPAPFAPPEQVRRRGRQRNHRQALAAGSAVLAVAGMGAGWALGTAGGDPKPPTASLVPPTATATPTSPPASPPTTPPSSSPRAVNGPVPASAMLRPEEFAAIGDPSSGELEDQGPDGPDWPWLTVLSECPDYQENDYPTLARRISARGLGYSKLGSEEWSAWEIAERYPDAAANLADVREAIARCPVHQVPDGVEIELTVVAERFAGDDSLLVRVRLGANFAYMVVVRVGNLVATLRYPDGPEADARDMAAPMAARLR